MLQRIHDGSKGLIMYIIIGLLIVVFTMWGVSYYLQGFANRKSELATVNGQAISEYAFNQTYEGLRQHYSGALSDTQIAALKHQALDQLITENLLYQASTAMGFSVSNTMIDEAIYNAPLFQEGGQFSTQKYQLALQSMGLTTPMLRTQLREQALINQVRLGITESAFVLPSQVTLFNSLLNEGREAAYVLIPFASFTSQINPTEAEITAYYHQHADQFQSPMQVQLAYIELSVPELKSKMTVSPDEARSYYTENAESFRDKNQKIAPFASVQAEIIDHLKEQKAEDAYNSLGDKLANLSFETPDSLTDTAASLGLPLKTTEFFPLAGGQSKLTQNPAVLKALSTEEVLNHRENSEVINLSNQDAVVIRVNATHPAAERPLAEVRGQIIEKLKNEKAEKLAEAKAAELFNAADLQKSALNAGYSWIGPNVYHRDAKNLPHALLNALFDAPRVKDKSIRRLVLLPGKGYAVLSFDGVVLPKPDSNLDALTTQVLQKMNAENDYLQYQNFLRAHAKIEKSNDLN